MTESKLIAIVGGSASGKTTLAKDLVSVAAGDVGMIPLDAYYRCNGHLPMELRARVNYDHPDAFEASLLVDHLARLRLGGGVEIPQYDFATHSRSQVTERSVARKVFVVEGFLALHFEELREMFSYSIFVDTPDDLRFSRRLARDVRERGRTEESVRLQWHETVQPMFCDYCAPTKQYASEVISGVSWGRTDVEDLWTRVQKALGINSTAA